MSDGILVCFAVKEEAAPFRKRAAAGTGVRVVLTGMGQRNAENSLRSAFAVEKPRLVLSCGFAGGLDPALEAGQILFSTQQAGMASAMLAEGARPARFHCAVSVAATAEEKRRLRQQTGADAVEMESGVICGFCTERGVPAGTIRVVLDEAEQDLPLDFNQVMTAKMELNYFKLALALFRRPAKIPALLRFQKQTRRAANTLAVTLEKIIARL